MAFRILSLDGGGTWSLIQIRVLQHLYGPDASGHEVLWNFRLVVANSGGSVVLGGLLADMKLSELMKLYLDKSARQAIFHYLNVFAHPIDRGVHALWHVYPQFSTEAKLKALQQILGTVGAKTLEAIANEVPRCPHILIPAFDYDSRRATFFRSDINSVANASRGRPAPTLAEAIHASSTAPVNFFDHPAGFGTGIDFLHRRFWDGAVGGYNNPVLAGAIEALANAARYECHAASIRALSIGTARTALPLQGTYATQSPLLVEQPQTSRPVTDIKLLATAIVDDPPDAASFAAHVMLGGRVTGDASTPVADGPVVRLNPLIQPKLAGNEWQLPDKSVPAVGRTLDIASFNALTKIDLAAVEDNQVKLIQLLCDAWMDGNALNQPVQAGVELQPLIGHRYYDEGVAAWMKS
jgi:hypothetical protein